jgi:curved DNA-binding protein CbpA
VVANHYQTLQLKPYASLAAIRGSYRRLARYAHPDVNHAPEATTQMQAVNEAYAVLRDPGRKAAYDRGRFARALQEVFASATAGAPTAGTPARRAPRGLLRLSALALAALSLAGVLWAHNPQGLPAASIESPQPGTAVEAQGR